ncbi:hypothetical protein CANCADRAFT_1740 [Tortispora caseinolytica NRRL Y-17796]|uniref:Transcription factor domain-containing protein n=1 Tax=Tortispora caseinolytica NRRL Y-17796 TaxID=767744 RepID=A0A1E4TE19_9ASCO|nr:hypothetical protein CANCADRAFT_1740 [Tortispora caseinolytica NRRL Y-17796]
MGPVAAPHGPPCKRCQKLGQDCVVEGRSRGGGMGIDDWIKKSVASSAGDQTGSVSRRSSSTNLNYSQISYSRADLSYGSNRLEGSHAVSLTETNTAQNESRHEVGDFDVLSRRRLLNTRVSNSRDALDLLLDVSQQALASLSPDTDVDAAAGNVEPVTSIEKCYSYWRTDFDRSLIGKSIEEYKRIWEKSWFVTSGAVSAQDAFEYVTFFFETLQPFTHACCLHYANPANHSDLIEYEPILCGAILTISSRYHPKLRSARYKHENIWENTKKLIDNVLYGTYNNHERLRSLGTIEGLLLLCEWHPTAIHLQPDLFGESPTKTTENTESNTLQYSVKTVRSSTFCSDRMSWMFLGLAITLAHELGVVNPNKAPQNTPTYMARLVHGDHRRRKSIAVLLYIYFDQFSIRLGWPSMVPMNMSSTVLTDSRCGTLGGHEKSRIDITVALIRLGAICKTFKEQIAVHSSMRSIEEGAAPILDHFNASLTAWFDEFSKIQHKVPLSYMALIELHYTRMYGNSIALQFIMEGMDMDSQLHSGNNGGQRDMTFISKLIAEIREASRQILFIALAEFASEKMLSYVPAKAFLRITSGCIFLIKTLMFPASEETLSQSLALLRKCSKALSEQFIDSYHISKYFANILKFILTSPIFPTVERALGEIGYSNGRYFEKDHNREPSVEAPNIDFNMLEESGVQTFQSIADSLRDIAETEWNILSGRNHDLDYLISILPET